MHGDKDLFDLKGRIAFVTGAGQGVGATIARTLASFNAGGVAVNDFFLDRAEAVANEIRETGVEAVAVQADVGDYAQVTAAVARVEQELGDISILVNNAGNAGPQGFPLDFPLFWQTEPSDWDKFFRVNLFGVMNCSRAVLPKMSAQKYGRIVTIVSDAGRNPEARQADYGAAKAGAAGFMRGVAADGARFGITANSIALATMTPNLPPDQLAAFLNSDDAKQRLSNYLIRRFGDPNDAAAVALLLCSDAGAWITGQTYPVNGGYSVAL